MLQANNATYNHVHANATSGSGIGVIICSNVTVSGGAVSSVTVYNGGTGFCSSDTITLQVNLGSWWLI